MTTTINADTIVGGAVVTADASGVLGLQAQVQAYIDACLAVKAKHPKP